MASDEHKNAYGDQSVVISNGNYLGQQISRRAGSDLEVNSPESKDSTTKDEPFGDETNSEVKYKTMTWWLVASPGFPSKTGLMISSQAMWNEFEIETRDQRQHFTDILAVMIAETISLGILSLPSALAAIGIVPYVRFPKS